MKGVTMKDVLGNGRTMVRWVLSMAAVVTFMVMAPAARAVIVTQSSAGLLIADGFDSDTPGTAPAGWNNSKGFSSSTPQVESVAYDTTHSLTPAPATANQPPNFLALRGGSQSSYQSFSGGPYTSGTITATFAFYITNAFDSNLFPDFFKSVTVSVSAPFASYSFADLFGFVNPDWITADAGETPDGSGEGEVAFYNGTVYQLLTAGGNPFDFTLNAWHQATVTYNIGATGAGAVTISVDNTTLDTTPTDTVGGSVAGFVLYNNAAGGGNSFVDGIPGDVPEPASMSLLAAGGVLLLRRRRA